MTFTKQDWKIGELQLEPERLFVVWLIGRSFCRTKSDFVDHFGNGAAAALPELESDGLVCDHEGFLCLTDLGRQAVSRFLTVKQPPVFSSSRLT